MSDIRLMSTSLKVLPTADFINSPEPLSRDVNDIESYISTHTFDANALPNEDDTICYYNNIPIGSKSNILTITGKAKSRKTVIASALATSLFTSPSSNFLGFHAVINPDDSILHIDTEQGYKHYYHSVKRVFNDASLKEVPKNFTSIHTRDADIKLRIEVIEFMLAKLKPVVLIIDGVTDLVYNINDQVEATLVGEKILSWSAKYNMLVITIIHTTKGTGYMTGAIGTYLEKKCETSIKVEKQEDDESISDVSCQLSRNEAFPTFSIEYDKEKGRYDVINEADRVASKGKGGNTNPEAYSQEVISTVLTNVFLLHDTLNEQEIKKRIKDSIKKVTGDHIIGAMLTKWVQYLNNNAFIVANPDGYWIRTGAAIRTPGLFDSPKEFNENEVDDLPF